MRQLLIKIENGFSLVELMIVVAIIGMLAAVGIPQYAKFQAKARQSEAKTTLSGLYATSRSFKYEWNTNTNNLMNLAFGVEGKNLRYITGFQSNVTCAIVPALGYFGPPETVDSVNVVTTATQTWTFTGAGNNSPTATWHNQITYLNHDTAVGSVCNQTTFTALAAGDPRNNPGPVDLSVGTSGDRWTIDQDKSYNLLRSGVN